MRTWNTWFGFKYLFRNILMQSCNRRNLFKSCCWHQIQNKLNMSKKDDCQPSIFFKFSKAFHCLGTLSCNTVVSSALTPATLRRSVCFFSPHRRSVCFSGCETKPLPYYSTSLQIGTSLRPVSLISFFFLRGQYFGSKARASLRCTALHGAPRRHAPEPVITFTIRWGERWQQLRAKNMFSLQIQFAATPCESVAAQHVPLVGAQTRLHHVWDQQRSVRVSQNSDVGASASLCITSSSQSCTAPQFNCEHLVFLRRLKLKQSKRTPKTTRPQITHL